MNDQDAEAVFQSIISKIRAKVDWLANEIEREVRDGKTTPKVIYTKDIQEYGSSSSERETSARRKVEYMHFVPYSPKEKLEIALQAIRSIVVSSSLIPAQVSDTLGPEEQGLNVTFTSEVDESVVSFDRRLSDDLENNGKKLNSTIQEILAELKNGI